MKFSIVKKILGSVLLVVTTSLSAAPMTIDIDVTGIASDGQTNDPNNTVLSINVGANSTITSIAYNVALTAFAPSYLSEIGVLIETSAQDQGFSLFFRPADQVGGAGDEPGSESYAGTIDLVADGISFAVGTDGILRLEFAEFFNDPSVFPDGVWNSGVLTFGYDTVTAEVPEPATTLLMVAGLAMLGYAGRRRSAGKRAA